MPCSPYLLGVCFLLAVLCIIVGIILTWVNAQKQEVPATPKTCSPRDTFPRERHYCQQCGWTTRPVGLYSRDGNRLSCTMSLCTRCVARANQKPTVLVPHVLLLPPRS
jgi:hypothetical protein